MLGITDSNQKIILDGLVMHWDPLHQDSYDGATVNLYDISGNPHTGTLTNGVAYSGDNGGSFYFDGTNDIIVGENPPQLKFLDGNSATFSVWIKPLATGSTGNTIYNNADAYGLYLSTVGTNSFLEFAKPNVANTGQSMSTTPVNMGDWNCLTTTVSYAAASGVVKHYINGELKATKTSFAGAPVITNYKDVIPGNYLTGFILGYNPNATKGNIGDCTIYNRVLSNDEVKQNFDAIKNRYFEVDAMNAADAFISAAGLTDETQKQAIYTLTSKLYAFDIWPKLKAIYPMVGGTPSTLSAHTYNLKNVSRYQLTFGGGWTHSATGALPDGTTGYINTNFNISTQFTTANYSYGIYSRTSLVGTGTKTYGVYGTVSTVNYNIWNDMVNGQVRSGSTLQNAITYTPDNAAGMFTTSLRSLSDFQTYKNGVSLGASTTSRSSTTVLNGNFYFSAYNDLNAGGAPAFFCPYELAFAFLGNGLTSQNVKDLYDIVQEYQTTLSRQV